MRFNYFKKKTQYLFRDEVFSLKLNRFIFGRADITMEE